MSASPLLPYPVAIWEEPPTALLTATPARTYWHYDAGTTTWTLTTVLANMSGELVDLPGTGTYTLELTGVAGPLITRLNATQRGTSIFIY